MTTEQLDRRHSVTRDDSTPVVRSGDVISIVLAPPEWGSVLAEQHNTNVRYGLPLRSQFNRARDTLLRGTLEMDAMWAAAVNKAITRWVALGWQVDDAKDIKTRAATAQRIAELYDNDFEHGVQRGLQDFLTTDNGQWVEIIRASKGPGSRVEGLAHLDSLRVTRTGDDQIPAIYTNLQGREKPLYAHQVFNLTPLPSPDISLRGVGFCAASAAWATILKMQAIETYFTEKVTGRRSLAIHLIRGINAKQLQGALTTAEADAQSRGHIFYRGAILIPGLDASEQVDVTTIPIADIPDGFDITNERERADNIYANTIGIFVGELRPLTGQGLGNGQQARLLEEAAEGVGLAAWGKQWTTAMKQVLPKTTVFRWTTNDAADRKRQAEANGAVVAWVAQAVKDIGMPATVAQQLLLDAKIIPPELAPVDTTAGGVLTDDEQAPNNERTPLGQPWQTPTPAQPTAAKARRRALALDVTDDVIAAATALRQEVSNHA